MKLGCLSALPYATTVANSSAELSANQWLLLRSAPEPAAKMILFYRASSGGDDARLPGCTYLFSACPVDGYKIKTSLSRICFIAGRSPLNEIDECIPLLRIKPRQPYLTMSIIS